MLLVWKTAELLLNAYLWDLVVGTAQRYRCAALKEDCALVWLVRAGEVAQTCICETIRDIRCIPGRATAQTPREYAA